jgi:hypothetical protein
MRYLKAFLLFWYEFIVGDDWTIAAGIVAALAVSALLVRLGLNAWWLLPIAAVAMLALSLGREIRRPH